jgi:hypothetical protein
VLHGWRRTRCEHREVVRILVLCVRTAPNLTTEDRQALDLLEAWSAGGEDRRKEAKPWPTPWPSRTPFDLLWILRNHPWERNYEVLEAIGLTQGRNEGKAEHDRCWPT